jgi:hypothetical protein
MAVTNEELRNFARFADEKLQNGGTGPLLEWACEWQSRRQDGCSNTGSRAIEVDAETLRELAKFFPDVQDEQQLQRVRARRGGVTTAEMLGNAMLAAARARRE